ncbi:hypothetical protein Ocin01_18884 [Orchesella cincta]|uniref:Uncharacterized protein n=1 Tax=Orchesella cincta TaxID=48709 RepID=A0A1D2M495_ORCCI|nr:hypothetical protein Ocin01_18884 [Orchesella cincta]
MTFTTEDLALNCYVCGHDNFDDAEMVNEDSSCKAGKKPKDEFSLDCSKIDYRSIGDGRYIGLPGNNRPGVSSSTPVTPNQWEITYTCLKATIDGKILNPNKNYKGTLRTCMRVILTNETYPDVCYQEENSKLEDAIKEDWFKTVTGLFKDDFTSSTKIGVCSCSTENCNSAFTSVRMHTWLFAVTTLVTLFGQYL